MALRTILQRIEDLKSKLDGFRPLDREQEDRILQKLRLDWNYHSSNIEGNTLTYGETKALLLFGITAQGKPLRHHFEITGHNEAVKWIMDVVAKKEPLTENLIRQLHTILLKESYQVDAITPNGKPTTRWIKVGQYKSVPNHVKTVTGEIFRFASVEETPSKMYDLINWFRVEVEKREVNPLVLAAEFHYRFIRIHPFDDGNGRIARLLMNFTLLMKGLPPVIVKTEDKNNYFAALRQADAGVLNGFVEYIGHNLIHSLELMVKAAKGERIEEEDDIDKEIALFKKELEGKYELLDNNPKSKVIEKYIIPFLDILRNKLSQLEVFFVETEYYYYANQDFYFKELAEFKKFTQKTTIDKVDLDIHFTENIYDEAKFSIKREFNFLFDKTFYSIIEKHSDIKIEKSYQHEMSEFEMTEIANQIAKSILEEIKSNIKN